MKTTHHVIVALSLLITVGIACGSEGESSDTTPIATDCYYAGVMYESGEEFATADGCVTYRCDEAVLVAIVDGRVTVPGDLDLPAQEDVDAQACLGVVEGSLTISGTAADLTPLAQLYRVGGTLDISASDTVTLDGLQTLGEVGAGIVIADNANLTAMAFLPYMSVFGDVEIRNNDALPSLAGAEFIGQCGNCSAISSPFGDGQATGDADQAPFGDEGGLPGGTFYGNILIADNDVLANIAAMSNLVFAWEDVRLRNNAALADLSVLALGEVRGDLEISNHAALDAAAADSFASVVDVWGLRVVCGNLGGTACP